MSRFIKITNRQEPRSGQPFVVRPDVRGPTYEYFVLNLKNVTPGQLKNFKVRFGNLNVIDVRDGEVLDNLNKRAGRYTEDGKLHIYARRTEMLLNEHQALYSWGTLDVDSMAIEFDIAPGITAPIEIDVKARVSAPRPLGLVSTIKSYPHTFAHPGERIISDTPLNEQGLLAFHLTTNKMSFLEVRVDSIVMFEGSRDDIKTDQLTASKGQRQLNGSNDHWTTIDFVPSLNASKYFQTGDADGNPALNRLEIKPTLTQPADFDLIVEYYGQLGAV